MLPPEDHRRTVGSHLCWNVLSILPCPSTKLNTSNTELNTPKMANHEHLCCIISDFILQNVVDNNDVHPDARKSAERIIAVKAQRRARRQHHTAARHAAHGPVHSIIPPYVFQAVLDSPLLRTRTRSNAEQNLVSARAMADKRATVAKREYVNRAIYDSQDRYVFSQQSLLQPAFLRIRYAVKRYVP